MWIALLLSAALAQAPTLPNSIPLNDSYYGDVTLAKTGPASWSGVKMVTLPDNPSCTAPFAVAPVTFALHYTLIRDAATLRWWLVMEYKSAGFYPFCPVASTAADVPDQAMRLSIVMHESGVSSAAFTVNGAIPGSRAWPVFRNVVLKIVLP
jgi:hypothetical protein